MLLKRAPAKFAVIDHFEVLEDITVGGANDKNILKDPDSGARYIAKLGRRNNDLEVITEDAMYLVGRSLNVAVATARVGRYKGQLRFLSEYFLRMDAPEELVHGVQLFNELYDKDTVTDVLKKKAEEQKMFSVQAVRAAFGAHYMEYGSEIEEALFEGFVSMLTHDALIGVMDRHHENWGVIVRRELGAPPPRFSPLYDSARGLFCNWGDEGLARFNGEKGSGLLDSFVSKARPLVGFLGLEAKGRSYVTHPSC